MKALVIQLLRMGDVAMCQRAIDRIKQNHPDSQVDILINDSCEPIVPILEGVDEVHLFQREWIQESLGNYNRSLVEPFLRVQRLLQKINSQNYDEVYNFTHTKLSAYLCGQIEAKKIIGLSSPSDSTFSFGSPWFQSLNYNDPDCMASTFHYIDVFTQSVTLDPQTLHLSFQDRSPIAKRQKRECAQVGIQISTSDEKKEWGDDKFITLVSQLVKWRSNIVVQILGSEGEADRVSRVVKQVSHKNVVTKIFSLEKAPEVIQSLDILITGDTLIKHLASNWGVPIIEIACGSSHIFETGAYGENNYIICSEENCFPCAHSSECIRSQHYCGINIPVLTVFDVARTILSGEAVKYRKGINISVYKTNVSSFGFWVCLPVEAELSEYFLSTLISRSSLFLLNHYGAKEFSGLIGSQSYKIYSFIHSHFVETDPTELKFLAAAVESLMARSYQEICAVRMDIEAIAKDYEDGDCCQRINQKLRFLKRLALDNPCLKDFVGHFDIHLSPESSNFFQYYKEVKRSFSELEKLLITNVKTLEAMERLLDESMPRIHN